MYADNRNRWHLLHLTEGSYKIYKNVWLFQYLEFYTSLTFRIIILQFWQHKMLNQQLNVSTAQQGVMFECFPSPPAPAPVPVFFPWYSFSMWLNINENESPQAKQSIIDYLPSLTPHCVQNRKVMVLVEVLIPCYMSQVDRWHLAHTGGV